VVYLEVDVRVLFSGLWGLWNWACGGRGEGVGACAGVGVGVGDDVGAGFCCSEAGVLDREEGAMVGGDVGAGSGMAGGGAVSGSGLDEVVGDGGGNGVLGSWVISSKEFSSPASW